MRILFMGSSPVSCSCLQGLVDHGHVIAGVVTQPDRPRGRRLEVTAGPVKALATSMGIGVSTPVDVNEPGVCADLGGLKADLTVVVAFGQILRKPLLEMAPVGCINVHASLLPKYRGAAPIQWAIACGESMTGVTIMHMTARLDAGDVILKREAPIRADDTAGSLQARLAELGAGALVEAVGLLAEGRASRTHQREEDATYARKLVKDDGRIDWALTGDVIARRARAFNPWPGSFCTLPDRRVLKVLVCREEPADGAPGRIVGTGSSGPLVAAGAGTGVRLLEVQPEGRKAMAGGAFVCGHALKPGDCLA